MDQDTVFQNLVKELDLGHLSEEEQEDTLLAISQSVQKQFFLDIYNKIGPEMFEALEASLKMGEQFYLTTLKHLVPDYEDILTSARQKILDAYKSTEKQEETPVVH